VLGPADLRPTPGEVISATPPINILLVDDNLRYRTQLRLMIGRAVPPAQVFEAENIQEALDLTKDIAPQLAFVDVVLGGENGIECTRQIRECSPLTRVLLLSAYPDVAFHRIGLEAGAAAFLSKKDLNVITLRQVIDDAI
jgi:DNA-binding NarL/FixJ family response regulator